MKIRLSSSRRCACSHRGPFRCRPKARDAREGQWHILTKTSSRPNRFTRSAADQHGCRYRGDENDDAEEDDRLRSPKVYRDNRQIFLSAWQERHSRHRSAVQGVGRRHPERPESRSRQKFSRRSHRRHDDGRSAAQFERQVTVYRVQQDEVGQKLRSPRKKLSLFIRTSRVRRTRNGHSHFRSIPTATKGDRESTLRRTMRRGRWVARE